MVGMRERTDQKLIVLFGSNNHSKKKRFSLEAVRFYSLNLDQVAYRLGIWQHNFFFFFVCMNYGNEEKPSRDQMDKWSMKII